VRVTCLLVTALSVTTAPLAAQSPGSGSRFLEYDHWSYEYIQRLRSRGYLKSLNPLVRPYRRLEVARGLQGLDSDTLRAPQAHWVRLLHEEFGAELRRLAGEDGVPWGFQAQLEITGSSSRRFDPLRPVGEEGGWPRGTAGVWAEVGAFAAQMRVEGDAHLVDEVDGIPLNNGQVGRTDHAYASVSLPFGSLAFGRLKQNWSVLGTRGVMISDAAPAYPQLAFEAHVGPLALRSLTGELETITRPTTMANLKRYISAHRFDFQKDNVVISVGEGTLFATEHGLQLRFLNPFEVLLAERSDEPRDIVENVGANLQVWTLLGGLELFGEFFLDDVDVSPGERDAEPFTYAFTVGTRIPGLADWMEIGVEYGQVSSFAYRPPNVVDVWSYFGRGLGANYSDFDRFTFTASLFPPLPGLRLTPTLQVQRQGEGDLRDPVPPSDEFLASPNLFLGVKETTVRVALRGRYQPVRYFWIEWDLGRNVVRDAEHVTGNDRESFEGVVRAGAIVTVPVR